MVRVPAARCINCDYVLDGATTLTADDDCAPRDGDFTVCIQCGHVMVFEEGGLRDPNDKEMHAIAGDKRLLMMQRALQRLKKEGW